MKKYLAFTILVVLLSLCVQTKQTTLQSVKENFQKIDKLRVEEYSLKIMECNVNYTFKLDIINNKTIIRFKGLNSNCDDYVYVRLNEALKDAVIVDDGEYYYLYMPRISDYVTKHRVQNSIVRYKGLPIITISEVVRTFDRAENVVYIGKENLIINGSQVDTDVFKYNVTDPLLDKVNVKVYIYENLPVKAIFNISKYNAKIVTALIKYEFGRAEDFDLSKYEIVERI